MARIVHICILTLLAGAIVHIAVLLLLPAMSERDAWSRLSEKHGLHSFIPVSELSGAQRILQSEDPYFEAAACRFNLAKGVARIRGNGDVPYWSASVYKRSGENIYSLNDRGTSKGTLDILLLSPAQMSEQSRQPNKEFDQSVFVDTPAEEGIIVVRAFIPDPSWKPAVSTYIKSLTCAAQ